MMNRACYDEQGMLRRTGEVLLLVVIFRLR